MYLPPGFDGRKFPLPRTTEEAFASPRSIFSQLAFKKRGARENAFVADQELFE
jgi:hypothetical protein